MRPGAFRALSVPALLVLALFSMGAQRNSLGDLCRLHGIGREEDLSKIGAAYAQALAAGISEEELYPFVEEILAHKFDCVQMVRVLSATTSLRREGLPYFVVFSKVREGVAKEAPPALVVEAAESKLKTLSMSRDVLKLLESSGYRILDYQNAAVIVSAYIEKGYSPDEVVTQVRNKGLKGAGFAALSEVLEKSVNRKER
jgi:hypothetical protein